MKYVNLNIEIEDEFYDTFFNMINALNNKINIIECKNETEYEMDLRLSLDDYYHGRVEVINDLQADKEKTLNAINQN